ncbi:DUF2283 domain-containing protein [Candidatus Woesearchaeota archaeon]|nr:DUF2283 domain-containing protein [Candidatus Woesearchaeota archaeon]
METWYDKHADVLNIEIEEGEYWKSVELANGIILDISKDGKVTGIEILKASKRFAGDVKKVIENAKVLAS